MPDRQRHYARQMRAEPTDAERVLWQRLRFDITVAGSHFRRQALIGPFIVDFASRKARLVIELDGGQHDWQSAADARRTAYIERRGYRVLRFWSHDVLGNIHGVLQVIQSVVDPDDRGDGARGTHTPRPLPARGRGALAAAFQL
jgi:very-short-patch-repair endonuclease